MTLRLHQSPMKKEKIFLSSNKKSTDIHKYYGNFKQIRLKERPHNRPAAPVIYSDLMRRVDVREAKAFNAQIESICIQQRKKIERCTSHPGFSSTIFDVEKKGSNRERYVSSSILYSKKDDDGGNMLSKTVTEPAIIQSAPYSSRIHNVRPSVCTSSDFSSIRDIPDYPENFSVLE